MSNSTPGKAHINFTCEECKTYNEPNITEKDLHNNTVKLICKNCGHVKEVKSQDLIDLMKKDIVNQLNKKLKLH